MGVKKREPLLCVTFVFVCAKSIQKSMHLSFQAKGLIIRGK